MFGINKVGINRPTAHTVTATPPPKMTANELLKLHGSTGGLILRLQRYAFLGWASFFVLGLVFVLYVFTEKFSPVPVIAVDSSGKLMGEFKYASNKHRTDGELLAGSAYFLDRYFSLNSATIYDDYASALNMMGEGLRNVKIDEVKKTGYLAQIDKAKSRSYIEYFKGERAPYMLWRKGENSAVRLRGKIFVWMEEQSIDKPFDITLEITTVARNTLATHGLIINAIRNN